jgi:hypothetical protein
MGLDGGVDFLDACGGRGGMKMGCWQGCDRFGRLTGGDES